MEGYLYTRNLLVVRLWEEAQVDSGLGAEQARINLKKRTFLGAHGDVLYHITSFLPIEEPPIRHVSAM